MNKILILATALLLGATGCNTDGNDPVKCDFDQQAMLTNYADRIIIPRFQDMALGVTLLQGSYNAFVANPTPGLLVEMRVSFAAAYEGYQHCSPLGFGPGLISGAPFRVRFNTFPTNTTAINTAIADGNPVSATSASAVGFPAVEYLLFGEHGTTTAQLVDLFTTDAHAANRLAYLGQLITELHTVAAQISADWGDYRSSFISNTGNAAGSSLSLLINEMTFDYETLKNFKFKIPLGKFNGGVVIPASVEAYYAGGSVRLAKEQVLAIKNLYLGMGENGSPGSGLYDYVLCAKPITAAEQSQGLVALADDIAQQFLDIQTALDAVPDPLSETLQSNKPAVDEAYDQMQRMVPLLKHEMTSALSVQISYQDNDGD